MLLLINAGNVTFICWMNILLFMSELALNVGFHTSMANSV